MKSKLNSTNNTIYILTKELENLQKEIEEKNLSNNKLFEDCKNLTYLLETKTNSIKQLKTSKKQLEQKNLDLELQLEKNKKEIEYLKAQNILNLLNSSKNDNKENNEYYEKQINDSNMTIKKMGEMIHELEKQIEELQKELENNNYIETNCNKNNCEDNIKELVDLIKKKDEEIRLYQVENRILNEEKSKLYEDNTKMYTNLDRFQKYIHDLIEENKKLTKKINKFTNSEDKSPTKEIKTLSGSDINEDDISNNKFNDFKAKLFSYKTNYKGKKTIHNENNKVNDVRYDELSDSQINENIRDIKRNKKTKGINALKIKVNGNKENESQNVNSSELNFEYNGKEIEELSD